MLAMFALLAAAAAAASPPLIALKPAETKLEQSSDELVVTGRKPARSEVQQQAQAITRADDLRSEPLARFEVPVCPGIIGLPADIAGLIVDRIRYTAERVGLRTADDTRCTPNILVIFLGNGRKKVEELGRTHGYLFADMKGWERKELFAETGPARAWSIASVRTLDGMWVQQGLGLTQPAVLNTHSAQSLLTTANRIDIEQSVVMFDIPAIDGLSVDQLADYAAMRALARTRVPRQQAAGTILALFDKDRVPPTELTEFDLAYLKSLYRSGPALPGKWAVAGAARAFARGQHAPVK